MSRHPDDIQAAIDSRFARFGLRPLSDGDVWALSMATMVMPDGSPGAEGYLSQVSGTQLFAPRLTVWGRVVAIGIASAKHKAKGGQRGRAYVEGYDESWGRFAVADGLTLALYGKAERNAADRVSELGCGRQGYERIRDFVAGALIAAIAEYRIALEWATGSRRDRVLSGRWEGITGLNWSDAQADAKIEWERGSYYPMFAPGTAKIGSPYDADQRLTGKMGEPPRNDPQTLYHGLRSTDWWSDGYALRTRKDCPSRNI